MTSFEKHTHVFILRVWRESREVEGSAPEWRGMIEHVPSGERRYVQSLDSISAFILPYLIGMGVRLEIRWRVRQWLNWWRLYWKAGD
jgi:hypothetical protein